MFLRYPIGGFFNNEFVLFFVADESVWKANGKSLEDLINGEANAMKHVYFQGPISDLRISPDGKWLAFVGAIENKFDVYVVPVVGGNPIRCTLLNSERLNVTQWIDNKKIGFVSGHESPQGFRKMHAYYTSFDEGKSVPFYQDEKTKGNARRLEYGCASWFGSDDKNVVIQENGYGYSTWKGYQGGTTGQIWLKEKTAKFKKITDGEIEQFNSVNPLICSQYQKIFFLNDSSGVGNVHSYDLSSGKMQQITAHKDYYLHDISCNQQRLFYSKAGEIFTYDIQQNEERKLNIDAKFHKPQLEKRFADIDTAYTKDYVDSLSSFALDSKGKRLGLSVRGQGFVMPPYVKDAQKLDGFGYTLLDFLGKDIVCVKTGTEEYVQILRDGVEIKRYGKNGFAIKKDKKKEEKKTLSVNFGHIVDIHASPCEKKILVINGKNELHIIDTENDSIHQIKKQQNWHDITSSWSPHGRYLAFASRKEKGSESTRGIFIVDTQENYKIHSLAMEVNDGNPVFDETGKYLFFLSNRAMRTSLDEVRIQLCFKNTYKPYVLCLQKEIGVEGAASPFKTWIKGEESETKDKDDKKDDKDQKKEDKEIDFLRLEERCYPFPVAFGSYFALYCAPKGVMWLRQEGKKKILEKYCFEALNTEMLAEDVRSVTTGGDKMALIIGDDIKICEIGKSVFGKTLPAWKNDEFVDWSRLNLKIDQAQEMEVIFQQAFLFLKEYFIQYESDKIDWDGLYEKYYKLLPQVSCRAELNYIISQMSGELGTSHSYTINPGDIRLLPENTQGYLGGIVRFIEDKKHPGYDIVQIFKSREWSENPVEKSALSRFEIGDRIISIRGKKLSKQYSIEEALQNTVGRVLDCQILREKKVIDTYLEPIANEAKLQYYQWIEDNKEKVYGETDGKVGYMHIPNMSNWGYEQFCRDYYKQYQKDVLIVDFRYNGGGYTSTMIVDILSRVRNMTGCTNFGEMIEPYESCSGKLVFLCNEHSGSDGDIFAYQVRKLGLGKLIGKRTWGGIVGILVRNAFIDGGMCSQPESGSTFHKLNGKEVAVENEGIDPDIEITLTPEDYENGNDKQLDKAVELAVGMLSEK